MVTHQGLDHADHVDATVAGQPSLVVVRGERRPFLQQTRNFKR